MSLVYRTVFEIPPPAVPAAIATTFREWIASKYPGLGVPGAAEVGDRRVEVESFDSARADVCAFRGRLREDTEPEHWTTTATAMRDDDHGWLWVDVERTATDVFSRRPVVAAPRFVTMVLEGYNCEHAGQPLGVIAQTITGSEIEWLVGRIFDVERELPIVAVSEAPSELRENAVKRAGVLARRVAGLATVVMVTPAAQRQLEARLGRHMSVFGGATRTYFPRVDENSPTPWRHPFIGYHRLKEFADSGARIIGDNLGRVLTDLRPPLLYRNSVRTLPGFPADPDRDPTSLLQQLLELEDRLTASEVERTSVEEAWAFRGLELEEAERELAKTEATIRYLEAILRSSGHSELSVPAPPFDPVSCLDVIRHARASLKHLAIPDEVDEAATDLDRDANAGLYAQKAWRALQALDSYAEPLANGLPRATTFLEYCREADSSRPSYSAQKVALVESETTDKNDRYRSLRTFAVHTDVTPDGKLYMPAHIKLDMGGAFPRLHFHDGTRSVTRRIHVGYLGRHRDSIRKN